MMAPLPGLWVGPLPGWPPWIRQCKQRVARAKLKLLSMKICTLQDFFTTEDSVQSGSLLSKKIVPAFSINPTWV